MKYIYTNVTRQPQACLLASKNQDSVGVRTFAAGASLTLDYPGLSMYVPHTLSCVEIDVIHNEPKVVVKPVPVVEPIAVAPVVIPEPEPEPIVEPVAEVVLIPEPVSVVEPKPEPKAKVIKPKTPRKTKK